jgi:hypothetical protein
VLLTLFALRHCNPPNRLNHRHKTGRVELSGDLFGGVSASREPHHIADVARSLQDAGDFAETIRGRTIDHVDHPNIKIAINHFEIASAIGGAIGDGGDNQLRPGGGGKMGGRGADPYRRGAILPSAQVGLIVDRS